MLCLIQICNQAISSEYSSWRRVATWKNKYLRELNTTSTVTIGGCRTEEVCQCELCNLLRSPQPAPGQTGCPGNGPSLSEAQSLRGREAQSTSTVMDIDASRCHMFTFQCLPRPSEPRKTEDMKSSFMSNPLPNRLLHNNNKQRLQPLHQDLDFAKHSKPLPK